MTEIQNIISSQNLSGQKLKEALTVRHGLFKLTYEPNPKILEKLSGLPESSSHASPKRDLADLLDTHFDAFFPSNELSADGLTKAAYYLKAKHGNIPYAKAWRLVSAIFRSDDKNQIRAAISHFKGASRTELDTLVGRLVDTYENLRRLTGSPDSAHQIFYGLLAQEASAEQKALLHRSLVTSYLTDGTEKLTSYLDMAYNYSVYSAEYRPLQAIADIPAGTLNPDRLVSYVDKIQDLRKARKSGDPVFIIDEDKPTLLGLLSRNNDPKVHAKLIYLISDSLRGDGSELGSLVAKSFRADLPLEIQKSLLASLTSQEDQALGKFVTSILESEESPQAVKEKLVDIGSGLDLIGAKDKLNKVQKEYLDAKIKSQPLLSARQWTKVFPEYDSHVENEFVSLLRAKNFYEDSGLVNEIIANQSKLDAKIESLLDHYIQSNAPPEPFSKMENSWGHFLKQLPEKLKHKATLSLLRTHGDTAAKVTQLIRQLDPDPGVREAVGEFLSGSPLMNGNRSAFSQEEVTAMFGGARFKQFFPWVHDGRLDGPIRTKFIIAVGTNPHQGNGINVTWLREKIEAGEGIPAGVAETLGFRPPRIYENLENQLNNGISDAASYGRNSPTDQAAGLTVQGHYEKNGRSIMRRQIEDRGEDQVEQRAFSLARAIEMSARSGWLSTTAPLTKRWFIYNWKLNANINLIETIRARAIAIANLNENFYELRVEIHNFPTLATLARVKRFLANTQAGTQASEQLRAIIQEIETLLGQSQSGKNTAELLQNLPGSAATKKSIAEIVGDFDQKTDLAKLDSIAKARETWVTLKAASNSPEKAVERYTGDRSLSDLSMTTANHAIQEILERPSLPAPSEISALSKKILKQAELDELLRPEQLGAIEKEIDNIVSAADLTEVRKLELISKIVQNSVDQIYFHVDRLFGKYDSLILKASEGSTTPPRFVDTLLRSQNSFMLSKLSDAIEAHLSSLKNLSHIIGGTEKKGPVEVFNPGEKIGILRFNKPAMELQADEIAVFNRMPAESAPVQGFITLGDGARLSHLQLLARSLKIPNAKVSPEFEAQLKALDGKWVRYSANEEGRVVVEEVAEAAKKNIALGAPNIHVPKPDHSVPIPVSFLKTAEYEYKNIAGPKGLNLARMFNNPSLKDSVPDGAILPFGFFNTYAEKTGLSPLLHLLEKLELKNENLISTVTERISRHLRETKIPDDLLDQVMAEMERLKERTGSSGFFFRSDTNLEDLKGFNGAGLNESVPNVPIERQAVEAAIRKVWISPFKEKSIYWRAQALPLNTVSLAEPSVVIVPTIEAQSSGVAISRGGPNWKRGHGMISANWGIGSVVEAHVPVEEITLENGHALRYALTLANQKPVAEKTGGLSLHPVTPGLPVLSRDEITRLNQKTQLVDSALGEMPHGWDIEWAFDANGKPWILQARPNE